MTHLNRKILENSQFCSYYLRLASGPHEVVLASIEAGPPEMFKFGVWGWNGTSNDGLKSLIEYGAHWHHALLLWRGYTSASILSASGWPRPQCATHPRYGSGIWQGLLNWAYSSLCPRHLNFLWELETSQNEGGGPTAGPAGSLGSAIPPVPLPSPAFFFLPSHRFYVGDNYTESPQYFPISFLNK
ncbi:hypothetical protein B0H10DRAFT_1954542 [Mycena sp. CBHHK59/15]|nr:hypothetical protein B0H10DRAFT_1954542 [Mycena sp. CBHHK59/15]